MRPRMCRSITLNTKATERTRTITGSLCKKKRGGNVHTKTLAVLGAKTKHSVGASLRSRSAQAVRLVGFLLCGFPPVCKLIYAVKHVPHHARVSARQSSKLRLRKRRSSLGFRLCQFRSAVYTPWPLDRRWSGSRRLGPATRAVCMCHVAQIRRLFLLPRNYDEGRQAQGAPQEACSTGAMRC